MAVAIFPPRPRGAIPPTELDYCEKQGIWCVQYKYNGSRCVIHVQGNQVNIIGRHGRQHRGYSVPESMRQQILALPGRDPGLKYWLDGELLIKTTAKDTKDKIVLFDVLQAGHYLFMKPNQVARLELLDVICGRPRVSDEPRGMGLVISADLMMAPTFYDRFAERFAEKIQYDECEGLVLRRKDSVLDNFGMKEYECGWLVRCREPSKNVRF